MGSEKSSGTTTVNQTTTATPTAEETALNQAKLAQYQQLQPQETNYYSNAYNLANALLTGQNLPGNFASIFGGLSSDTIGTQASNYVTKYMPGMQSLGITDSGEAAQSMAKGVANEVLLPAQEYNSNLLLNLLGLATGQSTSGTSEFTSGTNSLSTALAGLRSLNTSGTTNTNTVSTNPFITGNSLMSGIGTGIGVWGTLK